MKVCVITKCEDFADDFIVLRGSQWRYYHDDAPTGKIKGIKMPPFYKGEILILDDNDREIGPLQRNPYKWGAESHLSQGRCPTEFQLVNTLEQAVDLVRSLSNAQ